MDDTLWCGVDPGLANMGVAWLRRTGRRWEYIKAWTVETSPKMPYGSRLLELYVGLNAPLGMPTGLPRFWAAESQEGVRVGKRERGETNHLDDRIERVLGIVWTCGLQANWGHEALTPITEVTPGFVRKVLSLPPKATKQQIAAMVRRIVKGVPADLDEHATDALAIAIAGERKARGAPPSTGRRRVTHGAT